VTTNGSVSTPVLAFTYVAVPTAVTAAPDSGLQGGGIPVTVTGTGFVGPVTGGDVVTVIGTGFVPGQTSIRIGTNVVPASAVTVGGVATAAFGSARSLTGIVALVAPMALATGTPATFTMPAAPEGEVPVVVTTPGGSTQALTYTYIPLPPQPQLGSAGRGHHRDHQRFEHGAGQVVVTLPGGAVVTIAADQLGIRADGTALNVRMPASSRCGAATVRVVDAGGTSVALTYRYAGVGCRGLPATGSDAGRIVSLALVLLGAGALMVRSSHRRTRRAA
jgi:hypothetical protein